MSVQLFIKVPNIMQMPASTMQSTMTQRAITKMSRRYEPLFSSIPLFVFRLVMLMRCLTCFAFAMMFDSMLKLVQWNLENKWLLTGKEGRGHDGL